MRDPWWRHAACKGVDTNVFFPESRHPDKFAEARQICAVCPVIQECLDTAIREDSWFGMYGGMTREERRLYARLNGIISAPYVGCDDMQGTTAGYYREKTLGIPHCGPCLKAYNHAAAVRNSMQRRKAKVETNAGT